MSEIKKNQFSISFDKESRKEMEIWDETISDMWRSEVKINKKKKDE
jgi:hypothetical protein